MNPVPLFLIIVSLPLLLGGCGEKEVNHDETKPKLKSVNVEELEEGEGILYLKGSDTPFTGKVFSLYENGQKEEEANLKNGKVHGLAVTWHQNGQKFRKGNFKDGKPDGLATFWHENGQKEREENYKDGILISRKFWNSKGELVDSLEEAEK